MNGMTQTIYYSHHIKHARRLDGQYSLQNELIPSYKAILLDLIAVPRLPRRPQERHIFALHAKRIVIDPLTSYYFR
jgi:hypothetical protein